MESAKSRRSFIARYAAYGLGLYVVLMLIATLSSLPSVRRLPGDGTVTAGLGPVHLLQFHKQYDTEGYTLTVSPQQGMVWLFASCLSAELLLAWYMTRTKAAHPTDD